MRKKLLQHTLWVAVAVWAMHVVHGVSPADASPATAFSAQALAMR